MGSTNEIVRKWQYAGRICRPCPPGGVRCSLDPFLCCPPPCHRSMRSYRRLILLWRSPADSAGLLSCKSGPGYIGPDGGAFTPCPKGEVEISRILTSPRYTRTLFIILKSCQKHCLTFVLWAGTYKLNSATCAPCPAGGTTLDIASDSPLACVADIGHQGSPGGPFELCPIASYAGAACRILKSTKQSFTSQ